MSRVVPALCIVCVLAVAGTGFVMLKAGGSQHIVVPKGVSTAVPPATTGPAASLRAARRTCTVTAVDAVIASLREDLRKQPDARDTWHWLADPLLERSLLRSHDRGIVVGAPTFPQLPKELTDDLEGGLVAARKARELGDQTSDLFRIEAGLMSQRITGLASALLWNGRIETALQNANERGQDNPHLHVALGLRSLLTPKLLGHDPVKALEHFEFAAEALADDERPAVFAAMASYLQKKRQQAIGWVEQAVARNPENRFARVVLARLRAGEDDPFGRDVTAAEVAATK